MADEDVATNAGAFVPRATRETFRVSLSRIHPTSVVNINGSGGNALLEFDTQGAAPNVTGSTVKVATGGTVNFTGVGQTKRIFPPIVGFDSPPTSINEGEFIFVVPSVTSTGNLTVPLQWDIDGDGVFGDVNDTTLDPNNVGFLFLTWEQLVDFGIRDNGSYQIGYRATNADGFADVFFTLVVNNTLPTVVVRGQEQSRFDIPDVDGAGSVGTPYTIFFDETDPGDDRVFEWVVNWGDGKIENFGSGIRSASHTYLRPGPYDVTVLARDEDSPSVSIPYSSEVLSENPLAYYRLDETEGTLIRDSSPNQKDATITAPGIVLGQPSTGPLKSAPRFVNGSPDSSIAVPDLGTSSTITIEAWIYPTSRPANNDFDVIFNSRNFTTGAVHLQLISSGALRFTISGLSQDVDFGSASNFPLNTWTHVAVTYSNASDQVEAFANGVSLGTQSYIGNRDVVFGLADVGAWNTGGTLVREFDGRIDEVAIYPKALSAERIRAHFLAGVSSTNRRVNVSVDEVVANAGGPYAINQGESVTLLGSATGGFTNFVWDLNGDDDFSDATGAVVTVPWTKLVSLGLDRSVTYSIRGRADYSVGTQTLSSPVATALLTVENVSPTAKLNNSGAIFEGGTASVTFTDQTDPSPSDRSTLLYSYDFNNNGVFDEGIDIQNSTSSTAPLPASLLRQSGVLTIRGVVLDQGGGGSEAYTVLTITDVAPTIQLNGSAATINEGEIFTLNAGVVDAGNDVITRWNIDWGDGSIDSFAGDIRAFTHVYGDDGVYNVKATAFDRDGQHTGNLQSTVTVNNVLPVLSNLTAPNTTEGGELAVTGVITDPGTKDAFSVVVNWGDGLVENFALAAGTTVFSFGHRYRDDRATSVRDQRLRLRRRYEQEHVRFDIRHRHQCRSDDFLRLASPKPAIVEARDNTWRPHRRRWRPRYAQPLASLGATEQLPRPTSIQRHERLSLSTPSIPIS